jgi:hypothetical protein
VVTVAFKDKPISTDLVAEKILKTFLSTVKISDLKIIFNNYQLIELINAQFKFFVTKVYETFPMIDIKDETSFAAFFQKWRHLLVGVEFTQETVDNISAIIVPEILQSNLVEKYTRNQSIAVRTNAGRAETTPRRNTLVDVSSSENINTRMLRFENVFGIAKSSSNMFVSREMPLDLSVKTVNTAQMRRFSEQLTSNGHASEGVVFKIRDRLFIPPAVHFDKRTNGKLQPTASTQSNIQPSVRSTPTITRNVNDTIQNSNTRPNRDLNITKDDNPSINDETFTPIERGLDDVAADTSPEVSPQHSARSNAVQQGSVDVSENADVLVRKRQKKTTPDSADMQDVSYKQAPHLRPFSVDGRLNTAETVLQPIVTNAIFCE